MFLANLKIFMKDHMNSMVLEATASLYFSVSYSWTWDASMTKHASLVFWNFVYIFLNVVIMFLREEVGYKIRQLHEIHI